MCGTTSGKGGGGEDSREGSGPLFGLRDSLPGALLCDAPPAGYTFTPAALPTGYKNLPFVDPVGTFTDQKVHPATSPSKNSPVEVSTKSTRKSKV